MRHKLSWWQSEPVARLGVEAADLPGVLGDVSIELVDHGSVDLMNAMKAAMTG